MPNVSTYATPRADLAQAMAEYDFAKKNFIGFQVMPPLIHILHLCPLRIDSLAQADQRRSDSFCRAKQPLRLAFLFGLAEERNRITAAIPNPAQRGFGRRHCAG